MAKGPQDIELQTVHYTYITPERCGWDTCRNKPAAEEHQGDLYERDTEMVDGWFVYGRGPTAGASKGWETAHGWTRACVYRLPDDSGTMVENLPGLRNVHILVPDAVLLAVVERSKGRRV